MDSVIKYLRSETDPTSEKAHEIIDEVLAGYNCESPERHIVASGEQSVEPHDKGSGVIEKGVPVVIDIYPRSKETGSFADMSRTVCIGSASDDLKRMYNAVKMAQDLATSMLKPGVRCADVHQSVWDYFVEQGYETGGAGKEFRFASGFVHSLGHGVGKEIHEKPTLSRNSEDVLQEGDVITIEPGLYYSGVGGVRLENLILITADGYESLTNYPRILEI